MKITGFLLLMSAGVITLFGGGANRTGDGVGFAPPYIETTALPSLRAH